MPTTLLKLWIASAGSLHCKCGLTGVNRLTLWAEEWQQIMGLCCNPTAQHLGFLHSLSKAAFQILWGMSDCPDTRIIKPTAIIYYASLLCQSLCKSYRLIMDQTQTLEVHRNRASFCLEWKPRARLDWGVDLSWSFKLNSTPSWLCDLRWADNLSFRFFSSLTWDKY